MSKGATSKTTEKGTQEVKLPAWMSEAGQSLYNKTTADSAAHPIAAYTGQMSSPMAANQQQAGATATANAGAGQPQIAAGTAATAASMGSGGRVSAQSFTPAAAAAGMSPYLTQVQDRTTQEMQRQGQMQMQGLGDNAAASHAFGGTRQGVAEGEAAKGINNNILDYLSRSNQAGYESAQQQFNTDADRSLNAGTTNAGLDQSELDRSLSAGTAFGNLGQQASGVNAESIMNLLKTGGVAQETQNAQNGANYDEFLRLQNGDVNRDQDLMAILAGTPRNVTTATDMTTKQKNNPGWLATAMGVGQMAASAFSDPALKRDMILIDRQPDGLGEYEFDYIDDPALPTGRQRGVRADEVALLRPEALGPIVNGFATVDYDLLGVQHGTV